MADPKGGKINLMDIQTHKNHPTLSLSKKNRINKQIPTLLLKQKNYEINLGLKKRKKMAEQ